MKKFIYFVAALLTAGVVNAQQETSALLLEECFEYDALRPLVSDPVENSDNLDPITGWSTAANASAAINAYDIVEGNLTYQGYPGGEYGNAMHYSGNAGQGVFKIWDEGICKGKHIYMAFLLKVDNCTTAMTGGDYFCAFKMEPQANSWNWCGRLYMKVDPQYAGEEISFGIQKLSDCAIKWVDGAKGPFFPMNQTLLVVVKYYVGILNGESATEEAGNYDDEMYVYINPDVNQEPATATLTLIDANAKDMYRWGNTQPFGAARGLYFRSADTGVTPPYTVDGIRIGKTWESVMGLSTGLEKINHNENQAYKTLVNGQLLINKAGMRYSVLGTELK